MIKATLGKFTVGKTQEDEFDFLGRHVTQKKDYTIEVDMDKYLRGVEKVNIPMARRKQPQSPLTPEELHDDRSIFGQLGWPARQVMPQLAYHVHPSHRSRSDTR